MRARPPRQAGLEQGDVVTKVDDQVDHRQRVAGRHDPRLPARRQGHADRRPRRRPDRTRRQATLDSDERPGPRPSQPPRPAPGPRVKTVRPRHSRETTRRTLGSGRSVDVVQHGSEQPGGLPPGLGVLLVDVGAHRDAAAGAERVAPGVRRRGGPPGCGSPRRGRPGRRRRSSRTRRRTPRAASASTRSMISIVRSFGAPVIEPAGNSARSAATVSTSSRRCPRTVETSWCTDGVGLDLHQRRHLDRARLADHRQVVAEQVDDHQVLGAELRVGWPAGRARAASSASDVRRAGWCP